MKSAHRFARVAALAVCLAVTGCSSDGDEIAVAEETAALATESAALCVSSSCGEVVRLVPIPDAENLVFSPDGRLFVSGGLDVYEITKDDSGRFRATPITRRSCSYTGLAVRGNVLYANGCGYQSLFAAELTATPRLERIYDYSGLCLPNGLAVGPDGNLYAVDGPLNVTSAADCLPPDPKIVRLVIDENDPFTVTKQETWVKGSPLGLLSFGLDNVLRFPNGIVRDGNTFYGTDGGSAYAVDLKPDGRAGRVRPLSFEVAIYDDLGLAPGGLLLADFGLGRITFISRKGKVLQRTDPLTFYFPSSVRMGQPPMFEPTDILVTEKGILGDNSLPLDFLTLYRRRSAASH